ncbi:unnamed protein product [Toxocara canis]|uniref:ATP-dependent DNA helicase n=1 Tax=Toxocara canis TaxID=6265 RepID=A0A183TWC1_TOXCA|nr:unnamed protein product [Toxocara canis]
MKYCAQSTIHIMAAHINHIPENTTIFRVLSADVERWNALSDLSDEASLHVQRSNHFVNLTIMLVHTDDHHLDPAHGALLYQIIRQNNAALAFVQLGEEEATEINKIVRSAANCTHQGKLKINIPHHVYFCNGIEVSRVPLYDSSSMQQIPTGNRQEHIQFSTAFFVSAAPQVHSNNEKAYAAHVPGRIARHRKKPISKLKLQQMTLRRKNAILASRQKHHLPNIAHLPVSARRILCKYRRSCYSTGDLSFYTPRQATSQETPVEACLAEERERPQPPGEELSELALKLFCKYRKSCYEQIGAGHGRRKSAKRHRVLAGKGVPVGGKPRRKRTLKEIAEIALKHVDAQEQRGAQRPKPKMAIVKAKLNKMEEKRGQKLKCKYRKSCYETGSRPVIEDSENYFSRAFHFLLSHLHTPGEETLKNRTFHDLGEEKKKLFCKYRKSCYDTGAKPMINHEEIFKYVHMIEKHEAEIPIQIKCHYRKSCYETGLVPELRWSASSKEGEKQEETSSKDVPRTVAELKLRCRYKKSCYLQHAVEQASLEQTAEFAEQPQQPPVDKDAIRLQPDAPIKKGEKEEEESENIEKYEQPKDEITSARSGEAVQKAAPKKRIKVKRKPSEAQQAEHKDQMIPPHERSNKKYHIITSENETHSAHHRRRHVKHRLEQIAHQRKHARLLAKRKHTVLTQLSVKERKLLCKYRKSCYESGIPPMIVPKAPEPCEDELKEMNEAEIKVFCKYRKSCYDEIGTVYEKRASGKRHLVLAGKGMPISMQLRKKRTVKEMAEIALQRADKKKDKAAQRPQPKMAIVKAKLNKADQDMHRKLDCKYRKSCYESGVHPRIEYDNFLFNIYHMLARHIHTPGDEMTFNATFAELDDGQKKLFCKYRKPCYETGMKPNIDHGELFEYKHFIEKHDAEIPLEIKCHYRKSCYETGIVPDLRGTTLVAEQKQPIKKDPETIAELKLHCKYRKSCYVNKTVEQPEADIVQQPIEEEKSRTVLQPPRPTKQPEAEVKPQAIPESPTAQTSTKEEILDETDKNGEEKVEKKMAEAGVPAKMTEPPKIKPKPAAEAIGKPAEEVVKKQKPTTKEKVKATETKQPPTDRAKKSKIPEKKEGAKKVDEVREQTASMPTRKEEKVTARKEQKKEKMQKMTATDEEKLAISTPAKKEEPTPETIKPTKVERTKPISPKAKKEKKEIEEELGRREENKQEVEEKTPKMKAKKPPEIIIKDVEKENQTMIRKSIQLSQKISVNVPHKEIRYVPPPTPPSPEDEVPSIKEVHIEGDVETLEEKLRCKYRKSCYHNRTLPHPFEGFKMEHITKKEEQHLPLQYRCKYRKSCYETGELPHIGETFKVQHLVVKKDEHIPISLRCKYRKSCYETGEVPQIDRRLLIVTAFQNLLREFYEEEDEIRREMSEEERKLNCKYRKSCYATGKLPEIERETIKTIADTMQETTLSLHLRCKYRKSCYATYGIPIVKDIKQMRKPEAVIEKPSSAIMKEEKVKTSEERKPHPASTAEEPEEDKSTKKGKRAEKIKRETEDELEYMQVVHGEEEQRAPKQRSLTPKEKLKCKYRLKCYDGVPIHKMIHELRKEPIPIKSFLRADGRPCTIYHLSCRRMAGLPIKQRAPIGPNGRRLCRKKPKVEAVMR